MRSLSFVYAINGRSVRVLLEIDRMFFFSFREDLQKSFYLGLLRISIFRRLNLCIVEVVRVFLRSVL